MIKTEDLRKGNIITITGTPERIRGCVDNLVYFEDETSAGIGYCFGIPLTEIILLSSGDFGKWPDGAITSGNCEYAFDIERKLLMKHNEVDGSNIYISYIPIEHVHQLQNIWRDLTGAELTITP